MIARYNKEQNPMTFKKLLLIYLIFNTISVFAQKKELHYNLQSTFVGGTGNSTAFWGVSNQYGTISVNPNSAMLRTGLFMQYDTTKHKGIDYAAGLDILNRFDGKYNLFFQQYFLKLKAGIFTLQGGRIEELFGNQDSTLSSGGLLWSGNAPPMPKITVGILQYTNVPYTHGYLEIKGAISHGWFGSDSHVKGEWLHHKYIELRAGGDLPVKINFGFHHFVQWGGVSPEYGRLPSSFKDFWIVFRAKQVDTTGIPQGNVGQMSEFSNRIGNHLGCRDFGIDVNLHRLDVGAYFQSYFEDASSLRWHNLPDGLYGLYVKPKNGTWLKKVVIEYVATTNQCFSYRSHTIYPGSDDLFNNGVYLSGWTKNDFTIGSPFITSPVLLRKTDIPMDIGFDYLRNNKVQALHLGLEGNLKAVEYRVKLSYFKSYGTYNVPIPKSSTLNTYVELKKYFQLLGGIEVSSIIASDFGDLFKNKSSFLLTIKKNGILHL